MDGPRESFPSTSELLRCLEARLRGLRLTVHSRETVLCPLVTTLAIKTFTAITPFSFQSCALSPEPKGKQHCRQMHLTGETFLADAQQVSVQQPGGLQQASSPTAPQGLAGAGRRLRAIGPQTVSIYVAPQPGQVGCTDTWRVVRICLVHPLHFCF